MLNEKQNKKVEELRKNAEKYLKENNKLLKKYKLIVRPVVFFKNGKKPPFLSKFALSIISKQGGYVDLQIGSVKK